MDVFSVSPYLIAAVFFVIAFVYSSVGLGGGSSYTALLAIFATQTLAIPVISLTLNLLVTTVGSVNFIRHGHFRFRLLAPFLLSSMPMAYVGGALQLPKQVFYWLLLVSLMFVALRIYAWKEASFTLNLGRRQQWLLALLSGALLGLIAGVLGIGGGIYLVPLIIILGLGNAKQAAACGAIFVWLNSLSGLVSRYLYNPVDLRDYSIILVAVLAGGAIGSFMGSKRFSVKSMEKILGSIIIVAILFLLKKLLFT